MSRGRDLLVVGKEDGAIRLAANVLVAEAEQSGARGARGDHTGDERCGGDDGNGASAPKGGQPHLASSTGVTAPHVRRVGERHRPYADDPNSPWTSGEHCCGAG